jgi:hypothetical protein
MFSRQSEALGSDRQIKQILGKCYDLEEYVKGLERAEDDVKDLLKVEMVWELVEAEWQRMKGLQDTKKRTERDEQELEMPVEKEEPTSEQQEPEEEPKEVEQQPAEEESDEALLAELENL